MINRKIISNGFLLAWPIALQSILVNLLSMVDVAMVSHLGDTAVGAVGLGNRFLFMVMVIMLGIAWTVGVLSAQFYGAGQVHKIRNTIALAMILAHSALLPLFFSNIFYADNFIGIGTTNLAVIEQGKVYLWYALPSLSFVALILAYDNAFRALGQTKTPMVLGAIAIGLNIALNYWLIHGGLGIPALGVAGAAIATTLARAIQVVLIVIYLRKQRHVLNFVRSDFKQIFVVREAIRFLKLAVPMVLGFAVWAVGVFTYQVIYGRIGSQELAVMSVIAPFEAVFLSMFFGLASACAIMIGQRLGANRFDEAWLCFKSFTVFTPICAGGLGILIFATQDWVLMPFSELPSATLDVVAEVLTLVVFISWLKVINMTIAMGVLRAGGDNNFCTYIDIIGMWVVSIPATAVAAFYFDLPLIYVVFITYSEEVVKAVLFTWRANKKIWMRNLTVD